MTRAEQELQNYKAEISHQIAAVKNNIPEHKSAIQAIAQRSQKILELAVETFPLIDFRDWENIDLIIYYFETGRADDMKEALQLVDR